MVDVDDTLGLPLAYTTDVGAKVVVVDEAVERILFGIDLAEIVRAVVVLTLIFDGQEVVSFGIKVAWLSPLLAVLSIGTVLFAKTVLFGRLLDCCTPLKRLRFMLL